MKPKNFPERKNIKRKLAWNMLVNRFGKKIADNSFEENVELIGDILLVKKNKKLKTDKKFKMLVGLFANHADKLDKWLSDKSLNIVTEIVSLKNSISKESLREKRTKIFRGQEN